MRKRNWKIIMFRVLRSIGILCKKPRTIKLVPRVQSTVYPSYTDSFIKVQRFAYLNNKRNSYENCQFDAETETCMCGYSVDEFGGNGCSKRILK